MSSFGVKADRWRHLAPIHSWRATAAVAVAALPLLALGTVVVRGRNSADVPHLRAPAGASGATLPPPTTTEPSLTGVALPTVDGTTTVVPARAAGTAHLGGAVAGPGGPAPGATVHVERADGLLATDVAVDADGRYSLGGIAGGRYRVRAFLPPTLAMDEPQVLFLSDGEDRGLDLTLKAFGGPAVTASVAPDPPIAGGPLTIAVRVARQSVDAGGIVHASPANGALVTLGSANLEVSGSSTTRTGPDGIATFTASCRSAGPLNASVVVRATSAEPGQTVALTLPDCAPPAAATTAPPASGSTSTTSSSTTSTTAPIVN